MKGKMKLREREREERVGRSEMDAHPHEFLGCLNDLVEDNPLRRLLSEQYGGGVNVKCLQRTG